MTISGVVITFETTTSSDVVFETGETDETTTSSDVVFETGETGETTTSSDVVFETGETGETNQPASMINIAVKTKLNFVILNASFEMGIMTDSVSD